MSYAFEDTRHTDHAEEQSIEFFNSDESLFHEFKAIAKHIQDEESDIDFIEYAFELLMTNDLSCHIDFCDVQDFTKIKEPMALWSAFTFEHNVESTESIYFLKSLLGLDAGDELNEIMENN